VKPPIRRDESGGNVFFDFALAARPTFLGQCPRSITHFMFSNRGCDTAPTRVTPPFGAIAFLAFELPFVLPLVLSA
jgi:hypothetical protein